MRHIYYTIQTLLRGRGSNLVRLVSLTLGLLVGILLFSQIVYELNYDTAYRDADRLALFGARSVENGIAGKWDYDSWRPAAAALAESLPDEVECATPLFFFYEPDIYQDDRLLEKVEAVFADTLYFQTLGVELLRGDPKELAHIGSTFLSASKARELFGTQDPVGRTLSMNKRITLTVRGVYQDLPGNVSFPNNMVISLPTIEKNFYGEGTWTNNDIYMVYVRLRPSARLDDINRRLREVVSHYTPVEDKERDWKMECKLIPATSFYRENPDNVRRLVILFVLGFSIFFVSGMNYVLAAIATIGRRAKLVGVHKCCGADAAHVMSLFLWETGLLMGASILLAVLLMYLFADFVCDLLGIANLAALFTWQTLWVPATVVAVLFLLAGVLPGQLFARIPVTQVFRRYTDDKRSWKRSLLFVQFAGVAFILGMLLTTVSQYHDLMTRRMGFDTEGLVVGTARGEMGPYGSEEFRRMQQHLMDDLRRQPYVTEVGCSELCLFEHYNTRPLYQDPAHKNRISLHYQYVVKGFPQAVGMELVEGRWPEQPGEAVVGEKLVESLRWEPPYVNRLLEGMPADRFGRTGETARVVGVVRDIRNMGFFSEQTNVAFVIDPILASTFHVRLKEPMHDNLARLNDYVQQTYAAQALSFLSYDDVRRQGYESVYRFRNTVLVTSVCILLIVLMGLIGYTADETQRRSKEIAIRKVNGAEAADVLRLLSADILKVAAGAVLIGVVSAWFVSGVWMEQFVDCQPPSPAAFLLLALLLPLCIIAVVVLKARHIANENPVLSLKAE